jgi:hypothetical protein
MTIFRILKQLFLATLIAIFATQSSAMFIQPDWLDPTQPGVGLNRVAYSANDPVNLRDPGGNQAQPREADDDLDTPKPTDQNSSPKKQRTDWSKLAKRFGKILRGAKFAWDISNALEELNNERNQLYCGLSLTDINNITGHQAILPSNPEAGISMEQHAIGYGETGSQYISLTTDPDMAKYFATNGLEPSGMVAVIDGQKLSFSGGLRYHDVSQYGTEAQGNVISEGEILYEGQIPLRAFERMYSVDGGRRLGQ